MLKRIQEELLNQEKQFNLLQHNQRELSMVNKLEDEMRKQKQLRELRDEIEVLQYERKLQEKQEESDKQKYEERTRIATGYNQQLM